MASALSPQQKCAQGIELSNEDIKQLLKDPNHWMPKLVAEMGIQDALKERFLLSFLACEAMKRWEDEQSKREDELEYEQTQTQSVDAYQPQYIESGISTEALAQAPSSVSVARPPMVNALQQLKQAMTALLAQPAPTTAAQAASQNQQMLQNMASQVLCHLQQANPNGMSPAVRLPNGQLSSIPLIVPTSVSQPVAFDQVLRVNPGLVATLNQQAELDSTQSNRPRFDLSKNITARQAGPMMALQLFGNYLSANEDGIKKEFSVSDPNDAPRAFHRLIIKEIDLAMTKAERAYESDLLLSKITEMLNNNNSMIIKEAIQKARQPAPVRQASGVGVKGIGTMGLYQAPTSRPAPTAQRKKDEDAKYHTPSPFKNKLTPPGK